MNDLKLQFFLKFESLPKIYIVESLYTDQCISETHQQRSLLSHRHIRLIFTVFLIVALKRQSGVFELPSGA